MFKFCSYRQYILRFNMMFKNRVTVMWTSEIVNLVPKTLLSIEIVYGGTSPRKCYSHEINNLRNLSHAPGCSYSDNYSRSVPFGNALQMKKNIAWNQRPVHAQSKFRKPLTLYKAVLDQKNVRNKKFNRWCLRYTTIKPQVNLILLNQLCSELTPR